MPFREKDLSEMVARFNEYKARFDSIALVLRPISFSLKIPSGMCAIFFFLLESVV